MLKSVGGLFRGLSRFFVNLKIRHKFQLVFTILLITIFLVTFLVAQLSLDSYNQVLFEQSAQVLNMSALNVESVEKSVDTITHIMITDDTIFEELTDINQNTDSLTERELLIRSYQLMKRFWRFSYSDACIRSMQFMFPDGRVVRVGQETDMSEDFQQELTTLALDAEGDLAVYDTILDGTTLVFVRQFRNRAHLKRSEGVLIIRYDLQMYLRRNNVQSQLDPNMKFYMLTQDSVVYPGGMEDDAFWYDLWRRDLPGHEGYTFETVNGSRQFIAYQYSEGRHWLYVIAIEYNHIFQNIIVLRNTLVIALALLLLLALFVTNRLIASITQPLDLLVAYMQQSEPPGAQPLRNQKLAERGDEIGYLYRNFSLLVSRIDRYVSEDYKKRLLLKDYQYRSLQSQINPHFLYNTLDSINWLAKRSRQKDISTMVEALSHLMRYSISKNDGSTITLRQEIDIVKDYIDIQSIRFGEELQFELDVEEDLYFYTLPRLTIQPIVENCMNYAVGATDHPCVVRLEAHGEDNRIRLCVSDNGPGLSPEDFEKIASFKTSPHGLGIGLKNINERIKLCFGEEYGMSFENNPGGGLKVILTIPKVVKEDVQTARS